MKNWKVILLGGLVVGTIDLTYAMCFYGARGVALARIPQSIASGLLGPSSFKDGAATVVLGVVLQFVIATGIAAVYYAASRKLSLLIRQAVICGILYGVAVYCFMNFVVLPLSAAPKHKTIVSIPAISDFVVHLFGIGLPVALITRRGTLRPNP